MQVIKIILHSILFYVIWFCCVLGAAQGYPWFGPVIGMIILFTQYLFQRFVIKDFAGLISFMLVLTLVGSIIDTLLTQVGWIIFSHNPFDPWLSPPWMMVLWLNFAMVYYSCMQSWWPRYWLLGILSLVGFPWAYITGEIFGAARLVHGLYSSVLIGIIWAVLLPSISIYFSTRMKKND